MSFPRLSAIVVSVSAVLCIAPPTHADVAPSDDAKDARGVAVVKKDAVLRLHASPIAALNDILASTAQYSGPRVLAFGEYHQTNADVAKDGKKGGIPSALHRFSQVLMPTLTANASDLILETWITDGTCGKQETAAVKDVQKTTQRPATTEDELVTLVKQAKAAGLVPHILKLSCEDYKSIFAKEEVDYEKLLRLVTELLQKKIIEVTRRREKEGSRKHILVYGGALHNDLEPKPELASYSYGPALSKEFVGGYLEIDLYVPEFVERDESIIKEPWHADFKKRARPNQSVVINRSPGSYILLFPRTAKR